MDSVLYNSHPDITNEENIYKTVAESVGISKGTADEVIIATRNDIKE